MRFLSRFSIKRIPYVFAFLLPPQVQDISWTWVEQGKDLRVVKARTQNVVAATPFLHRFISWTPRRELKFPDAFTGEWMLVDPWTSQTRSLRSKWSSSELKAESTDSTFSLSLAGLRFRISEAGKKVELVDPQNSSQNAWVIQIPTQARSLEWSSDERDFIYALARETREIFVIMPRSLRSIRHIQWDPGVEIIDVLACPGREQLIVEQPHGTALTRVVRLREWTPVGQTIFDLSRGKVKSDVTRALSLDCRTIFFAGPYGLQKVQY